MPIYSYRCTKCERNRQEPRFLSEREDGPTCDVKEHGKMVLYIDTPPMGIVKNPAVPSGRRRYV